MSVPLNNQHPPTPVPVRLRSWIRARHAAVPTEHGSWVFIFSPLLIGLAISPLSADSFLLVFTVLSAFMARQPMTLLVKVYSHRRQRSDLQPALFWLAVYGSLAGLGLLGLIYRGYGFLLWLVLPAIPVLSWHLWLISRRAERRKPVVEIAGSGVLALAAPAAYWVSLGYTDPLGWLLWALCWAHAAGTILYAYLRLEQRKWKSAPPFSEGLQTASLAMGYNFALLLVVLVLSFNDVVPQMLWLPYLIQPLETVWGTANPAVGVKPTSVGIRQMIISILFVIAFILAWRAGG